MKRELEIPIAIGGATLSVGASVYEGPSGAATAAADVVYFHGGGLFFGTRDDLPEPYLRMFAERGHRLWALDYPLAPEVPLPQIRQAIADELAWLAANEGLGRDRPLVLFGRSAGAYLALRTCADLLAAQPGTSPLPRPAAVLSLYGYANLTADFLITPSRHYTKVHTISEASVTRRIGTAPITSARLESRFPLYLYARQTGRWDELLGLDNETARTLSVSDDELAGFPPTFCAASTSDNDVPYSCSKHLARTIPEAHLHTVYYLEHDFDRDTTRPEGPTCYESALTWLDNVLAPQPPAH